MPLQTAVFLDYQNIYSGARETFDLGDDRRHGQIDPVRLAHLLVGRSRDRKVSEIRIYRGLPDALKQPKGYRANRRQVARWEQAGCTVILRGLRYPSGWPAARAVEQGVDVALAVDFVMMAFGKAYDRAILMSTDTNLRPALAAVASLPASHPVPMCDVAAWSAVHPSSQRLSIPGRRLWCHWLDRQDYEQVKDLTDYTRLRP